MKDEKPPHGTTTNSIAPFRLENGLLRGRFVRLGTVLDEILAKHDYPYAVARLLAETLATGAALAGMLKFDGRFTLQAKGDGAVRLLVSDMTAAGGLRAYAKYDAAEVARMGDEGIGLLGQGHLAFTVEPPAELQQESYQGIVALRGKDIAAAAQNYFRQSEQIPTGLMAAARRGESGHWQAAALILQQMPDEGGAALPEGQTAAEFWQHVMVLMSSCTPQEMLDPALPAETLLYRLFHGEGVRSSAPLPLSHVCTCATRIRDTLRLFSRAEVEEMKEDGVVTMTCQFCSSRYQFDEAAIAEIFASA